MHRVSTLEPASNLRRGTTAIKKLGFAGFTFFLVKGLLWLVVPGIIAAAF